MFYASTRPTATWRYCPSVWAKITENYNCVACLLVPCWSVVSGSVRLCTKTMMCPYSIHLSQHNHSKVKITLFTFQKCRPSQLPLLNSSSHAHCLCHRPSVAHTNFPQNLTFVTPTVWSVGGRQWEFLGPWITTRDFHTRFPQASASRVGEVQRGWTTENIFHNVWQRLNLFCIIYLLQKKIWNTKEADPVILPCNGRKCRAKCKRCEKKERKKCSWWKYDLYGLFSCMLVGKAGKY